MSCCLWYKDTNLKANHNGNIYPVFSKLLLLMVQRY